MAIKGSLREASLTDVLQLLTMGGKSGCLSVTDGQSFGYIYFDEGRIIYASLLNRRDRLGDILIRENAITRPQLDEAIQEQSRSRDGRRLGQILTGKGYVDQETLKRSLFHQIEEAVYHLFTWSQGTFYFEPGQLPEGEDLLVSIDPESLLLEGARRVDEWSQIEKKIPSQDLIFALDSGRSAAISSLKLTEEQEKILPYLDGKHSIWQIVEETALAEFRVGKALYGLITAGLVRRAGRRERPAAQAGKRNRLEEHRNLGIAFYKTAMYDEAAREFGRVLNIEPQTRVAEFYLGLIAIRKADYSEAEARLRGLLDRGVTRPAVFNNLAFVLAATGRIMDALSVLEHGLKEGGDRPRLHLSKALLQLRLGDPAAAQGTLEAYVAAASGALSALYYSLCTLAEAMSADLDAAVRVGEEGLRVHAASPALANNVGVVFERKGFSERARELYERALELDVELPQASKNLGDILYRGGMYEQAARSYERALRANPHLGDDVYAKLGNVYYRGRDRERAVLMWKRALEYNPMNEVVRTNLEFVEGASGAEG
jgi:tetratricopeptide (TPR) repeat protein